MRVELRRRRPVQLHLQRLHQRPNLHQRSPRSPAGARGRAARAIKRDLLSDASIEEFKRRLRRAMARPDPTIKMRAKLEAEVGNLTDAIAKGLLSPALARRLQNAEAAVAALPMANVTRMDDLARVLPQAVERYRRMVSNLHDSPIDVPRARALIRDLIGEIRVEPRGGRLIAKLGLQMQPQASQIGVVAGARYFEWKKGGLRSSCANVRQRPQHPRCSVQPVLRDQSQQEVAAGARLSMRRACSVPRGVTTRTSAAVAHKQKARRVAGLVAASSVTLSSFCVVA